MPNSTSNPNSTNRIATVEEIITFNEEMYKTFPTYNFQLTLKDQIPFSELNAVKILITAAQQSYAETLDSCEYRIESINTKHPPRVLPDEDRTHPYAPLAIIIGHNSVAKGAFSRALGYSEYDYYNNLVRSPLFTSRLDNKVVPHTIIRRVRPNDIVRAYNQADHWLASQSTPGITVELHFNGSVDRSVNYSTTLYYENSTKSRDLAEFFEREISTLTGVRSIHNRGVDRRENGGFNLTRSQNPSILIEPFFGSFNKLDAEYFDPLSHLFPRDLAATLKKLSKYAGERLATTSK